MINCFVYKTTSRVGYSNEWSLEDQYVETGYSNFFMLLIYLFIFNKKSGVARIPFY